MSDSLPIREVILRDFEALIAFCESLLSDAKEKFPNRVRSAELMLRARNLIRRACGEGSEHYRVLLELAEARPARRLRAAPPGRAPRGRE